MVRGALLIGISLLVRGALLLVGITLLIGGSLLLVGITLLIGVSLLLVGITLLVGVPLLVRISLLIQIFICLLIVVVVHFSSLVYYIVNCFNNADNPSAASFGVVITSCFIVT